METEFGVAPRRIRPSLDFGVDKIMRYGVGNYAIRPTEWGVSVGSGALDMEWKS